MLCNNSASLLTGGATFFLRMCFYVIIFDCNCICMNLIAKDSIKLVQNHRNRLKLAHSRCLNGNSKSRTCPASNQLWYAAPHLPANKQGLVTDLTGLSPASSNNCFCRRKETWVKSQNIRLVPWIMLTMVSRVFLNIDIGKWVWSPYSVRDCDVCITAIFMDGEEKKRPLK